MTLRPALIAAAIALSGAAHAASWSFTNITGNSATNAAAGEAQLSLSVFATANPQLVRFTLSNASGLASSVKAVFVDNTGGALSAINGFNPSPGVTFVAGTNGALPGGNTVGFNESHPLGVKAPNQPPVKGINPGETFDWTYTLASGVTVADVEDALNSGLLRFGVHMIAFPNGGSEAFVTTPNPPSDVEVIPAPLAGMTGAAGLALLASRRRR